MTSVIVASCGAVYLCCTKIPVLSVEGGGGSTMFFKSPLRFLLTRVRFVWRNKSICPPKQYLNILLCPFWNVPCLKRGSQIPLRYSIQPLQGEFAHQWVWALQCPTLKSSSPALWHHTVAKSSSLFDQETHNVLSISLHNNHINIRNLSKGWSNHYQHAYVIS